MESELFLKGKAGVPTAKCVGAVKALLEGKKIQLTIRDVIGWRQR